MGIELQPQPSRRSIATHECIQFSQYLMIDRSQVFGWLMFENITRGVGISVQSQVATLAQHGNHWSQKSPSRKSISGLLNIYDVDQPVFDLGRIFVAVGTQLGCLVDVTEPSLHLR